MMSFNIYEAASGLFTPELITKAGYFLNESETNVSKAIQCIIPTIIKGILSRSASVDGANTIALLSHEQYINPVANNMDDFLGDRAGSYLNPGSKLLSKFLGDKTDIISAHVSDYSGIRISSSMSLLSMATPAILQLVGQYASINRVNADKLASMLSQHNDFVAKAMPSGYKLNGVFNNWENAGRVDMPPTLHYSAPIPETNINAAAEKAVKYLRWLLPLMIVMLIAVFIFTCNR